MSEQLKRVRKGTKSCTECRRRKVRCTWSSDEASKCRRCEERGTNCVAQIYSVRSSAAKRLTSRDRIARLEQRLTNLTSALQSGGPGSVQSIPPFDSPISDAGSHSDTESEDSSVESGGFVRDPPTHLSTLFDNDLISSDTNRHGHETHKTKVIVELHTNARQRLQELIPPRKEVEVISNFASIWLSIFHALFPAPSMIKSGEEMLAHYEAAKSPSVDPAFLASWLLSIAMTIHQVPKEKLGPERELKGFRNAWHFSKSVSDVVEATIMSHDTLIGTTSGIDAAMLYLRLQLSRGDFKKTWLQLRRVIAVAELVGLHRAARRTSPSSTLPIVGSLWSETERINARKAQVWESLCTVDRIAGMMFNLPPGTRRYRLPQDVSIVTDGNVSLRAYLRSLSEIAMRVQDLDDLDVPQHADAELYPEVLKIDGELRVLASVTPASWWNDPTHRSDYLLQYWHFYITVRVHLPFTLRHDTSELFSFSRLACLKACQTLLQRYQHLRGSLPNGFFLCRIIDLQVFTAVVVLIMAYHAATPKERSDLLAHGLQPPELLVSQILDYMKSILHDPVSSYVRQAVDAVSTLSHLLNSDGKTNNLPDLKLKVPLLGKLHIRRKQKELIEAHGKVETLSKPSDIAPITPADSSTMTDPNINFLNNSVPDGYQDNFPMDPWSWSIEDDQSGVFQDGLILDDFSPLGSWWDQSGMDFNSVTDVPI